MSIPITLKDKYGTYEEENLGKAETVTAFAGGGQGSATQLTLKWNIVTTCASDNDSVKLLAANIGLRQVVFNDTANILSVFPQSGESIDGITNLEYKLPAGFTVIFQCQKDTKLVAMGVSKMNAPYKKYVANGTVSGGVVTPTVFENTLGVTPTWTYEGLGIYQIHAPGVFLASKVHVLFSVSGGVLTQGLYNFVPSDIIEFDFLDSTSNPQDGDFSVEIRVYP